MEHLPIGSLLLFGAGFALSLVDVDPKPEANFTHTVNLPGKMVVDGTDYIATYELDTKRTVKLNGVSLSLQAGHSASLGLTWSLHYLDDKKAIQAISTKPKQKDILYTANARSLLIIPRDAQVHRSIHSIQKTKQRKPHQALQQLTLQGRCVHNSTIVYKPGGQTLPFMISPDRCSILVLDRITS